MVTRFSNTPQKTFTADFEVKEYCKTGFYKILLYNNMITSQRMCLFIFLFDCLVLVLPVFEVMLKPSKSFFYVGDPSLTVNIEAK